MIYYYHFPRDRFLIALLDGWRLPLVVQGTMGHHGAYSITLWRPS